jgi:hypothetical protein
MRDDGKCIPTVKGLVAVMPAERVDGLRRWHCWPEKRPNHSRPWRLVSAIEYRGRLMPHRDVVLLETDEQYEDKGPFCRKGHCGTELFQCKCGQARHRSPATHSLLQPKGRTRPHLRRKPFEKDSRIRLDHVSHVVMLTRPKKHEARLTAPAQFHSVLQVKPTLPASLSFVPLTRTKLVALVKAVYTRIQLRNTTYHALLPRTEDTNATTI